MLHQSFFAEPAPQPREVTLPDGTKHTLFFKELSVTEFRRYSDAISSPDEDVRAGAVALIISLSLCTEDGKPAVTFAEAKRLRGKAADELMRALMSVNGFDAKKA